MKKILTCLFVMMILLHPTTTEAAKWMTIYSKSNVFLQINIEDVESYLANPLRKTSPNFSSPFWLRIVSDKTPMDKIMICLELDMQNKRARMLEIKKYDANNNVKDLPYSREWGLIIPDSSSTGELTYNFVRWVTMELDSKN